jgi:hypothetical protein
MRVKNMAEFEERFGKLFPASHAPPDLPETQEQIDAGRLAMSTEIIDEALRREMPTGHELTQIESLARRLAINWCTTGLGQPGQRQRSGSSGFSRTPQAT